MNPYFVAILVYLLAINIFAFVQFGLDKRKAVRQEWRTSEAALLFVAIVGGSIGALIGMRVWRHKTQHAKFRIGLPIILLLQILVLGYVELENLCSILPQ